MTDRTALGSRGSPDILPFRDLLDGDTERGVALYDEGLQLCYANPAARAFLHGTDGRVPTPLLDALSDFRTRLERAPSAAPPGEILLEGAGELRRRVLLAPLIHAGRRFIVARTSPPGFFATLSVRGLQERFRLTLREAQVAMVVARGLTNEEAANELGIRPKTVKNALMAVFAKCRVRNRVELVLQVNDAPR